MKERKGVNVPQVGNGIRGYNPDETFSRPAKKEKAEKKPKKRRQSGQRLDRHPAFAKLVVMLKSKRQEEQVDSAWNELDKKDQKRRSAILQ